MAYFVLTYDVRAKNHDYKPLYDLMNTWRAAHLQDSIWLAELNGTAKSIRETMRAHMHSDDTVCVIQVFHNSGWATWNARKTGVDWLSSHMS